MGFVSKIFGGGKTSSSGTQTQVSKPFPEQLPFVTRIFDEAQTLFDNPPPIAPAERTVTFSPETEEGLTAQTNVARLLGDQVLGQRQVLNSLLAAPDPTRDPTVQAFADAATRPLEQRFQREILPQIGSQAVAQGAFGGSRQALQEAQAAEGLARSVGDVRAGIFNDAFGRQLDAQQRALALSPQINQQLALPAQLITEVGAARENLAQQQLDDAFAHFRENTGAPLQNLQNFSNLINQFGGQQSTTTLPPSQRGGLQGALGGASTGAGLASALSFNPLFGAIGGGLLGLF